MFSPSFRRCTNADPPQSAVVCLLREGTHQTGQQHDWQEVKIRPWSAKANGPDLRLRLFYSFNQIRPTGCKACPPARNATGQAWCITSRCWRARCASKERLAWRKYNVASWNEKRKCWGMGTLKDLFQKKKKKWLTARIESTASIQKNGGPFPPMRPRRKGKETS